MTARMLEAAEFTLEEDERGAATLALRGPMRVWSASAIDSQLAAIAQPVARIDLGGVSEIDTTGAWLVWRTARDHDASIVGASDEARRLIEAVSKARGDEAEDDDQEELFERVAGSLGQRINEFRTGFLGTIGFFGAVVSTFGSVFRHPSRFRPTAFIRQVELVGVNSLGIIGLMSFLVGIVVAQQGAVQLRQFGAEIYTINLTGRLAFRELGVLMTAIMVAGRSGSAFAAQIGTMKLTEEVDAMRTIGVSPLEALVLPRVLAAMLMMPLLGFYASVMAIIGGAAIADLALDIPFFTFLTRIQEVVPVHDLMVGLVKGPVFGLIVAIAGCYHGMQVSGNAEEVGLRTTQAVVTGIFAVIVLDAFFAVFFTKIGWV